MNHKIKILKKQINSSEYLFILSFIKIYITLFIEFFCVVLSLYLSKGLIFQKGCMWIIQKLTNSSEYLVILHYLFLLIIFLCIFIFCGFPALIFQTVWFVNNTLFRIFSFILLICFNVFLCSFLFNLFPDFNHWSFKEVDLWITISLKTNQFCLEYYLFFSLIYLFYIFYWLFLYLFFVVFQTLSIDLEYLCIYLW